SRSRARSTARSGRRTRRSSFARSSLASVRASSHGSSSRPSGTRWSTSTRSTRSGAWPRGSSRSPPPSSSWTSTRSSARGRSTSAARRSRSTSSSSASRSRCARARARRSRSTWRASAERDARLARRSACGIQGGSSMRRMMLGGVVAVTLAALAAIAWAQHGHGSVGAEGHQVALAFAADQNGYPGPMHVLELRDRLKLTADQATKMQELMHAMFAESRPQGARLLEAEAKLRRLFADRTADEAAVRGAVGEVERARSEVRLVHLLTHLKTRDLLTEDQRRVYHEARWGAIAPAR